MAYACQTSASSKPVRSCNPPLGRFDSCAGPLLLRLASYSGFEIDQQRRDREICRCIHPQSVPPIASRAKKAPSTASTIPPPTTASNNLRARFPRRRKSITPVSSPARATRAKPISGLALSTQPFAETSGPAKKQPMTRTLQRQSNGRPRFREWWGNSSSAASGGFQPQPTGLFSLDGSSGRSAPTAKSFYIRGTHGLRGLSRNPPSSQLQGFCPKRIFSQGALAQLAPQGRSAPLLRRSDPWPFSRKQRGPKCLREETRRVVRSFGTPFFCSVGFSPAVIRVGVLSHARDKGAIKPSR